MGTWTRSKTQSEQREEGNAISAVYVERPSGGGDRSGAWGGAGDCTGAGACRGGPGIGFAGCKVRCGSGCRDNKNGQKGAAAADGHARDGTDFWRGGGNRKGV